MSIRHENSLDIFDVWLSSSGHRELHSHDFHEIFLTLEGRGEQQTPLERVEMRPGDLFFFPAGLEHVANSSREAPCLGGVVYLREKEFFGVGGILSDPKKTLKALCEQVRTGSCAIGLDDSAQTDLTALFKQMLTEWRTKKPGYQAMVAALMQQFFIVLMRHARLAVPGTPAALPVAVDKIGDIVRFLDNHFSEPADIGRMATMANMSRSYFHASFRQVTGQTFVAYLNHLRVRHAEKLLATSTMEVEQIAKCSGFGSLSQFYNVFKQSTGTTPKRLRDR